MLVFYDALLIVPWFVLFNQRVQMCNSLERSRMFVVKILVVKAKGRAGRGISKADRKSAAYCEALPKTD